MTYGKPPHMAAAKFTPHPAFQAHFKSVGLSLCAYERKRLHNNEKATEAFRQDVSLVPVEILEAYLEDLLDLHVPEQALSIERSKLWKFAFALCMLGLGLTFVIGIHAASSGQSLLTSLVWAVLLAIPFGVLWHYSPQTGLSRRLVFARVLSQEIARRRGRELHDDGSMSTGIQISRLFVPSSLPASSFQGAAFKGWVH